MTRSFGDGIGWSPIAPGVRQPTLAANVVATSQPLAAQAGLLMLQKGGNAVDAALAAAIALTVVEPVSTGLGSDLFALVWDGGTVHALNGSGCAPKAWTQPVVDRWDKVPAKGWASVTVPGAVAAWVDLAQRFGRLSFETLFEPAIELAARGFAVSPSVADRWQIQVAEFSAQPGFAEAFLPDGHAPRSGERFQFPALAKSLRSIAETRGKSFYEGALADAMIEHGRACGGSMALADLAEHRSIWGEPVTRTVLGQGVHQLPPNNQGLVVLMALEMLSSYDWPAIGVTSPRGLHLQLEAYKLAAADVSRHVADPGWMEIGVAALLDKGYLRARAALIAERAQDFGPGLPAKGGTVCVAAADRDGRVVSLMQSNFAGFGSGVVVPGTGISLHNRAAGFTLQPGHPNRALGGKRPAHTVMPAFVTRTQGQHRQPLMTLGVTGGNMQPQGQIQLLLRVLAGENPQGAIDAPRFRHLSATTINVEPAMPAATAAGLAERGHRVEPLKPGYMDFGSAQIAYRLPESWLAATDSRKDGAAVGF